MKRFAGEVDALQQQIEDQALAQKDQLRELETAITEAEVVIPEEFRATYRRIVGRYGADALAACDDGSCQGCYTTITSQTMNDLINGHSLSFCLSCGRLLYRAEEEVANTRRK